MPFDYTKIPEWLDRYLTPRIALGVFLLSALLLRLSDSLLTKIGIKEQVQRYHPWIVLACLASICALAPYLLIPCGLGIKEQVKRMLWKCKVKTRCRDFSPKEKELFALRISNNEHAIASEPGKEVMLRSLEAEGILKRVSNDNNDGYIYIIDSWVFTYLKKHPELYEPPARAGSELNPGK